MTDHDAALAAARRRRVVERRWQLGVFLWVIAAIEVSYVVLYSVLDQLWIAIAVGVVATTLAILVSRRHNRVREFAAAEFAELWKVADIEAKRTGPDPVVVHRTLLDLPRVGPFLAMGLLVMTGGLVDGGWTLSRWVFAGLVALIYLTVYLAAFGHQPVGTAPLLVLGRDGIEFAHLRLFVPWPAIGHAHLALQPDGVPVLRWHLLDPEAAMVGSRLGDARRKRALQRIRNAGGTVDIPSTWMREPPEVALGASRRLAEVARGSLAS